MHLISTDENTELESEHRIQSGETKPIFLFICLAFNFKCYSALNTDIKKRKNTIAFIWKVRTLNFVLGQRLVHSTTW